MQLREVHIVPSVLTIAGSDSGAGAGIQADIKTLAAYGVFGCSAITAITAQNTQAVIGVWPLTAEVVVAQVEAVLQDFEISAIKLGMLQNAELIEAIGGLLSDFKSIPIVCDPVIGATAGGSLSGLAESRELFLEAFKAHLLPQVYVVTPNIDEAAALLRQPPATTIQEVERQAKSLLKMGPKAVLMTGGHLPQADQSSSKKRTAVDVLCYRTDAGEQMIMNQDKLAQKGFSQNGTAQVKHFVGEYIQASNTHGTGCTLSSAIAANIALGKNLEESVASAKSFVFKAIETAQQYKLGQGNGPVNPIPLFNNVS